MHISLHFLHEKGSWNTFNEIDDTIWYAGTQHATPTHKNKL